MKKYKVYWSIFNLASETQSQVVKLQQTVKGILGTLTAGTWLADSASHAMWIGFGAMIIDTALGCLYLDDKDGTQGQ